MGLFSAMIAVYLAGIVIGLLAMRDPWPSRIVTALAWPLGLVAFVVVLIIMAIAATYLWPIPILGTLAVIALAWLTM